jgi:gliding motility-associated-like protein
VNNGSVFLCRDNFTFLMEDTADMNRIRRSHHPWAYNPNLDLTIHLFAFRLVFENANAGCFIQGSNQLNEYYNYYIGNDRSKWAAHVNGYYNVTYHNIYNNIDLIATSEGTNMKYNFVVKKGGKASDISVYYEGAQGVSSEKEDLLIQTSLGILRDSKPYAYQQIAGEKHEVKCAFQLKNNRVCFVFPEGYDVNEELVIDPILIFSTFSGSTADNFGYSATYDSHGNAYAAGTVFQENHYPTTTGAFQNSWAGGYGYHYLSDTLDGTGTDIGITKYDSSGTQRIYSTYLGGDLDELPHSLVVNNNDELFILGTTGSNNFPVTPTAFDTSFNGGPDPGLFGGIGVQYKKGCDIFITRFNAEGTALLASTYLGGSDNDGITYPEYEGLNFNYADEVRGEINVDNNGNVFIASCSRSKDFPVSPGAYQTVLKGVSDGVVVKMNDNLTNIIWSTFLGDTLADAIYSLDFDNNGNLYVAGGTESKHFPVTTGALQTVQPGGRADGFIAHLSSNGSTLLQSTYYGSPEYDQVYFVRTDKANNVYVYGQTEAVDSTFIKNAAYNNPRSGQFISKITPALDSVVWSTVFGSGRGQPDISPTAFLVDVCNKAYISGWGSNFSDLGGTALSTEGLQVTSNAIQDSTDGQDFYVMVMEEDASALDYATYFGSPNNEEHVDGGTSRFDRKGIIYESVCAGCGQGNASIFPTTPGAVSNTDNSPNCNNAVFKLDLQLPTVIAAFFAANTACITSQVQFTSNSKYVSVPTYQWSFGDGDSSAVVNPKHAYTSAGTYTVQLIVFDSASCNLSDTISRQIVILASGGNDTLATVNTCLGHAVQIGISPANDSASAYQWTPAAGLSQSNVANPVANPATSTLYQLIVSGGACDDTFSQQVNVLNDVLSITGSNALCSGDTIRLNVSNSNVNDQLNYQWQPASEIVSGANSNSPLVQPAGSVIYTVTGMNTAGCTFTDSIQINITSSLQSVYVTATPDTIHFGDTSQLHLFLSTNVAGFQWVPDTTLSATNIGNPLAYPRQTNTYYVQVTDSFACKKEDTITIYVIHTPCSEQSIYIPNGFSPNGDGKNDILYVRGNGISNLYFAVYDRWGQKVFETRDMAVGWDGTYKGKKMDDAVFGYYASGICPNGEKFQKKGNVTLLR